MLYVVSLQVDECNDTMRPRYSEAWDIMARCCPKGFTPKLGVVMSEELSGPDKLNLWVLLESDGKTEQDVFDAGVDLIQAHIGEAANELHFQ